MRPEKQFAPLSQRAMLDDATRMLCSAIASTDIEACRHAIAMGADVNARGEDGWCLLSYAVMGKVDSSIVRLCIRTGARPNTFEHDDPLYWAVQCKRAEVVEALVDAGGLVFWYGEPGAPASALHEAAGNGDHRIISALLRSNGREYLNEFDYLTCTPLCRAVRMRHVDAARVLLDAGSDVNKVHADVPSDPALKWAVESGDPALVQLLLSAGADPAIPGWCGLSAMDKALKNVDTETSWQIAEMLNRARRI